MEYGYCRVSTKKLDEKGEYVQTTDLQKDALIKAGVLLENIFEDRISGKSRNRPGLDALMNKVQKGDEVLVWKLDRLGRSARNLLEIAEKLDADGVSIRSLQDGVDTKGPYGRFLLIILAAVAELERENIRERVIAGMATAKRQGIRLGRSSKLSPGARADVRDSYRNGVSASELAKRYRVGRATIYRVLEDADTEKSGAISKQPRLQM